MTEQPVPDGSAFVPQPDANDLFPVVGIGASAGGLEAVRALLGAIPANPGVAFVLVQHLDPNHTSALAEILSKATPMEVQEAKDQLPVRRNHVYVMTPATEMVIEHGRLRTTPRPASRKPPMAIDTFLTSLALERGPSAVGVILSGTGSDGTNGLKAIKAEGGITFAQDATAAYDPMPRSAIAAGCVDFVLSPEKIAAELLRSCSRMGSFPIVVEPPPLAIPEIPAEDHEFLKVLKLLSQSSGIDFTNYKYPTLRRRIERRMVLRQKGTLSAYLELVRVDPAELEALRHEILIQVTSFFRDPETFDELKASVLPQLLNDRPVDSPIRIWIPGCSSGEEAYSLIICIMEFLEASNLSIDIKAFATDVSERAVDKARAGIYPESISTDVSPERLARFFRSSDGGYQINKVVRDACVFARQDVTRDPPFSQLDLISCRNVLIYLGAALQTRVFPVFHYALKPDGFLILGSAESVGPFTDLFEPFDKRRHFFRRSAVATRLTSSFATGASPVTHASPFEGATDVVASMYDVQHEADRIVLSRYAPCGVVINESLEVVQFRGRTGQFLEPAPGMPTNDILQMVRDGLLPRLRMAIEDAKLSRLPSRQENIRFNTSTGETLIHAQVIPFAIPTTDRKYFVVLFEEIGPTGESTPPRRDEATSFGNATESEKEITRLRHELGATKAYLQSVIESKNFANEELKAANEEIVSSNEELQSTNEELETAKEELQATNEELGTVNEELQSRIQTTSQLNDDLVNLIDSVNIPIVIVGLDLRVRRFGPHAVNVFNLIPGDIGRLITDLTLRINVPDLKPLIERVIKTLVVQETEVIDQEGRWYQLSIRPYRTTENRIDGAVIALFDVNAIKQREQLVIAARDFSRNIIATLHESLLLLDERLRVSQANPAFYETFQTSPAETEGQLIYSLGNSQWNIPELRELLERLLATSEEMHNFRLDREFPLIGRRTMLLNARRLRDQIEGQAATILLAIQDITTIEETMRSLKETEARIQTILDTAATAIVTMDERGIVQSFNRTAETMFGYAAEEVVGQNVKMLMPEPYQSAHDGYVQRYVETGDARLIGIGRVVLARHRDGTTFPADLAVSELVGSDGRMFTGCLLDISERRALEREVLEVAVHEQQRIGQELHDVTGQDLAGLSYLTHSLVTTLQSKSLPEADTMVRVAQGLETALKQIRSVARGLIPVDVTAEGLRTALQVHIEKTIALTGIPCVFQCKPTVLVENNQVATQLFFIAREAIANAVKHARAAKIEVKLETVDHVLQLEIRDDGIGVERVGKANGVGLRIMAYRAGLLNGILSIGTDSNGHGTVVTCRIPLFKEPKQ